MLAKAGSTLRLLLFPGPVGVSGPISEYVHEQFVSVLVLLTCRRLFILWLSNTMLFENITCCCIDRHITPVGTIWRLLFLVTVLNSNLRVPMFVCWNRTPPNTLF